MKLMVQFLVWLVCVTAAQAQECGRVEFTRFDYSDSLAGMIIRAEVPATGAICYNVPISSGQDTEVRLLSGEGILFSWGGVDPEGISTPTTTGGSFIFEMKFRDSLYIYQIEGATKPQRIKFSISTNPNDD